MILLWLLLFGVGASAQTVGKKGYRQQRDSTDLERAEVRRQSAPQEAIRLLNRSLQSSLKAQDNAQSAAAYVLLGQIYEDIGQPALALKRYQQAMPLWGMLNRPEEQALNLNRMGRMQLALGENKAAEQTYRQCLNLNGLSEAVQLQCKEGLADAQRQAGVFEPSNALYSALNTRMEEQGDSIGIARVSAKQSQNYLTNAGDRANAQRSYNSAVKNLPKQVEDYEAYRPIEEAKEALSETAESKEEQLALSQNTLNEQRKRALPPEVQLKEQLQLASLELEEGDVESAEETLDASEALAVGPEKKAELYKLRSSVQLKKGDYQSAVEAYQRYVAANEQTLLQQRATLEQRAAILQEQGDVDLAMKDYLLQQSEQNLLRNQLRAQWVIIGLLALLLLAVGIGFWGVRKQDKKRRRAYQLLGLKSLRTQMNPHFIFNALNSINNFIAQQDERAANKYLADFSRLMRMVLEYSQKDFIPFEEELRLLELYLKLEHARFGEQFEYEVNKGPGLNLGEVEIPPMLLQPFVENAIWHGLRYKSEKGRLSLSVEQDEQGRLLIKIADDGIGRARSQAVKTKHQAQYKSTGLSNIHQRMELINTLYDKQYELSITDLHPEAEDTGTLVKLSIPS
jgi:hypothetical protein